MTQAQADSREPSTPESVDAQHGRARRYAPLAALLVVLVLAGVGWLLVRQMMADSKLQDCVMSGRKNCAPVEMNSAGK
jgi:cell division septal protein FtsQ